MNQSQKRRSTGRSNGDFKQYLVFEKKFGYLHDFREIPNTQPRAYAAKISVPQGQGDRIRYVNFELYVKSAEALSLFLEQKAQIEDKNAKVTVRFSCSHLHPKAYIAQSGDRAGQIVPYMSGNLSYLFSMKVNGVAVYGYRNGEDAASETPAADPEQQDADAIDTVTGEVLPNASNDAVPQLEDVPIEAYGDVIDEEGYEMDLHSNTDDLPGNNGVKDNTRSRPKARKSRKAQDRAETGTTAAAH